MPVISAFKRQKEGDDGKFKVSLGHKARWPLPPPPQRGKIGSTKSTLRKKEKNKLCPMLEDRKLSRSEQKYRVFKNEN